MRILRMSQGFALGVMKAEQGPLVDDQEATPIEHCMNLKKLGPAAGEQM